jgi:pimeloyl-ACP methyl ester carboxylesterase
MDILRAALGEAKLNYLGKSYGTYLGAVYAGLFPKLVGRFVLDGVLPPDETSEELALDQAVGFERATRAWAQDCAGSGDCPLGDSTDQVMQGLRDVLRQLDSQPLPMRDGRESELTEGWAALGVAQAMYDQGQWSQLTDALTQVVRDHNGTDLMQLADAYAHRDTNGRYQDNLLESFYSISCLDHPDSADPAVYEKRAKAFEAKAPTFGALMAWGSQVCGEWPIKSGRGPHKITAEGSDPIVVVGTTRDPATPYESSVRLRDQLANARLLTMDGDGHTAYMRHNDCIDKAINDYYTAGTVPRDGLKC